LSTALCNDGFTFRGTITVITWNQIVPIGKDEKAFFVQLGARIAALRKAQSITQVQLAELLKVSQQTINAYEVGRRRMPVSSLPVIARYLGVSIEELIGEPPSAAAKKRGPTPKIQQQIERIQRLPKTQQRMVMQMIDAVLAQQGR
jgi:transcriptional regulator with XRE-family HTH domain